MLRPADNELLTRVEGDAPMGQMMRAHCWFPALRSAQLVADGDPVRVKLLGSRYVAFRGTDGVIGFMGEACPHRGVSLALARNEGCALRCIFHGWKIHASGQVLETPAEPRNPEAFAAAQKVRTYPTREAGSVVWVFLGDGEPPKFPDFEFGELPAENMLVLKSPMPFNWLQGVEGTLDSSHVGILHADFLQYFGGHAVMAAQNLAPRYEVDPRDYGFRAAAVRPLADGSEYVRTTEFVMPFYTSPVASVSEERAFQVSVPVDDHNSTSWLIRYNLHGPYARTNPGSPEPTFDPDDYCSPRGGPDELWGQDREAMRRGVSTTGILGGALLEDAVVQASMGSLVDRSQEHLSSADLAIVKARRLLLQAVRDFAAGKRPAFADPNIRFDLIRAEGGVAAPGTNWREQLPERRQTMVPA